MIKEVTVNVGVGAGNGASIDVRGAVTVSKMVEVTVEVAFENFEEMATLLATDSEMVLLSGMPPSLVLPFD